MQVFEKNNDISVNNEDSVTASSYNTAVKLDDNGPNWIFGFEKYMELMNSFTPKGIALIRVNVGSGTPELAAAWVKYANKIKGYGIKYWEIGNENGGHWEVGGPMNVYDYTRRYIKYYEAMKAVDPAITIIAQGQSDSNSQTYDGVSAIEAFLGRLAKEKKLHYVEGLVSHHYPTWGMKLEEHMASPGKLMKKMASDIEKALKKYPKLKNVPVWVTEYNSSGQLKPHDITVRLDNGLWLAMYTAEFIRNFGTRGYMMLWDAINGGNAIHEEFGGDGGFLQAEAGPYQYQERAAYWAMLMLTNYFSSPGDTKLHKMVKTDNSEKMLASYSNIKPDGTLSLMVVNTDKKRKYETEINISNHKKLKNATVWSFDKSNYKWDTSEQPYHANPSNSPTKSKIKTGKSGLKYTFPPYSITVIELN